MERVDSGGCFACDDALLLVKLPRIALFWVSFSFGLRCHEGIGEACVAEGHAQNKSHVGRNSHVKVSGKAFTYDQSPRVQKRKSTTTQLPSSSDISTTHPPPKRPSPTRQFLPYDYSRRHRHFTSSTRPRLQAKWRRHRTKNPKGNPPTTARCSSTVTVHHKCRLWRSVAHVSHRMQ